MAQVSSSCRVVINTFFVGVVNLLHASYFYSMQLETTPLSKVALVALNKAAEWYILYSWQASHKLEGSRTAGFKVYFR